MLVGEKNGQQVVIITLVIPEVPEPFTFSKFKPRSFVIIDAVSPVTIMKLNHFREKYPEEKNKPDKKN